MANEHKDVSPATAGGAPAPDPNAVDNALAGTLIDQYGFLPLSVRFSAAAAARAVTESWTRSRPVPNAEILPAERKPVLGEPGVDTVTLRRGRRYGEEAIQAMLPQIRRVGQKGQPGLELNWYDMAANAFSAVWSYCEAQTQTDPRDAEIEQLRGTLQEIADLVAADATRPDSVRSAVENWLFELDQRRGERDEARMEWKRADAEVTRLRGEVDEHRKLAADLLNRTLEEVAGRTTADMIEEVGARWVESGDRGWRDSERWRKRAETAEAERDRLRKQLDQHLADENSAQAANDRLRAALANAEANRDIAQANERDLRRRLKRIAQETSFESALPDTDGEVPF